MGDVIPLHPPTSEDEWTLGRVACVCGCSAFTTLMVDNQREFVVHSLQCNTCGHLIELEDGQISGSPHRKEPQ
mgnify:CR=1 FL=1